MHSSQKQLESHRLGFSSGFLFHLNKIALWKQRRNTSHGVLGVLEKEYSGRLRLFNSLQLNGKVANFIVTTSSDLTFFKLLSKMKSETIFFKH